MNPVLEATQPLEGHSQLFQMSVEFYQELGRLGMLGEKDWELLDGFIIERMPKSPLHEYIANILVFLLGKVLGEGAFATKETSLSTEKSEPIPDVMVLSGQPADYALKHPSTALLVIEISVTSEKMDRAKAAIYASANVAEYWILNPTDGWIDVYTHPTSGSYANVKMFGQLETVFAQSITGFKLCLRDILPKQEAQA